MSYDSKPHIIIPYYVYSSNIGCVGQKICGLIFGLSSKYGYCTAKNEYFAKFFYGDKWEDLIETQKIKKIAAMKRQINILLSNNFIKNVGTKTARKLTLKYMGNDEKSDLDKTGKNFPIDTKAGKNFPKVGKKFPLLPIIYNKYILKSKSSLKQGQKTTKEMFESLFLYFWEAYPRKEKKKQSRVLFLKLKESDLDKLLERLPLIVNRYQKTEKQFIPLATSFLNGELWEDEVYLVDEKSQKGGESMDMSKGEVFDVCVHRLMSVVDTGDKLWGDVEWAVLNELEWGVEDVEDKVLLYGEVALRSQVFSIWDDCVGSVSR